MQESSVCALWRHGPIGLPMPALVATVPAGPPGSLAPATFPFDTTWLPATSNLEIGRTVSLAKLRATVPRLWQVAATAGFGSRQEIPIAAPKPSGPIMMNTSAPKWPISSPLFNPIPPYSWPWRNADDSSRLPRSDNRESHVPDRSGTFPQAAFEAPAFPDAAEP